jgi:hypothetical protein
MQILHIFYYIEILFLLSYTDQILIHYMIGVIIIINNNF